MFYWLKHYDLDIDWLKQALVETFGEEDQAGGWKSLLPRILFSDAQKPIPTKAYSKELGVPLIESPSKQLPQSKSDFGYLNSKTQLLPNFENREESDDDDEIQLDVDAQKKFNIYAKRKYLNPIKLILEFPFCLLCRGLERLSLLDVDKKQNTLKLGFDFRTVGRLIFVIVGGIPYGLVCCFTSPINKVLRPFLRFLKEIWDTGIWGVDEFGLNKIGSIGLVLITMAVIAFCLASVFTGGIFSGIVFLGAASSLIASFVPVLASALTSIAATMAGWFAISSFLSASTATIVATVLAVSIYVIGSVALIQRFFEAIIPSLYDFYYMLIGRGGYSKDQHHIILATLESVNTHQKYGYIFQLEDLKGLEPRISNCRSAESKFANSSAMGFLMYNFQLGTIESVSYGKKVFRPYREGGNGMGNSQNFFGNSCSTMGLCPPSELDGGRSSEDEFEDSRVLGSCEVASISIQPKSHG